MKIHIETGCSNARITVGDRTSGTAQSLSYETKRADSDNTLRVSIGKNWCSFKMNEIEFQVYKSANLCGPLRDAIDIERKEKTPFSQGQTNVAVKDLYIQIFASLSYAQLSYLFLKLHRDSFRRGWKAKENQIRVLKSTIKESEPEF